MLKQKSMLTMRKLMIAKSKHQMVKTRKLMIGKNKHQ